MHEPGYPSNDGRASHERVLEALSYDAETGIFVWLRGPRRGNVRDGDIAGNTDSAGYRRIALDGRLYKAHRLAWFFVHKVWPEGLIDHINGDRLDNRIANLRNANKEINAQNIRRAKVTSVVGLLGVSKLPFDRYRAIICAGGKRIHIGTFSTPEEAHAAHVQAKRRLHVGCTI